MINELYNEAMNNWVVLLLALGVLYLAISYIGRLVASLIAPIVADQWDNLPVFFRSILMGILPDLEGIVYAIWISVHKPIETSVLSTTESTLDDKMLEELDRKVSYLIDKIDGKENIG